MKTVFIAGMSMYSTFNPTDATPTPETPGKPAPRGWPRGPSGGRTYPARGTRGDPRAERHRRRESALHAWSETGRGAPGVLGTPGVPRPRRPRFSLELSAIAGTAVSARRTTRTRGHGPAVKAGGRRPQRRGPRARTPRPQPRFHPTGNAERGPPDGGPLADLLFLCRDGGI
jgi:hypothetical protein